MTMAAVGVEVGPRTIIEWRVPQRIGESSADGGRLVDEARSHEVLDLVGRRAVTS
jgi:hypothetical protein